MKKSLICVLLMMALLWMSVPSAQATASLCFVAMNDTLPLTLDDGSAPYYKNGKLYLPYTAFRVNPNSVGASYNAEKETFVLFNRNEMLLFDLEHNTYTDNQGTQYDVQLSYRGGILYVPAAVASHFGLSVTMLTSRDGYPIIRFTNGEEVYDDGTFVAQAETLIRHITQEYAGETETQNPTTIVDPNETEDPPTEDPETIEVYLAFVGDAVSEETVRKLEEHNIQAAFFLTEEQLSRDRDLVRTIYASGHTVGLTVAAGEPDVHGALQRCNDVLDSLLFCRTVFALVPQGTATEDPSYHILTEPSATPPVEEILNQPETQHLYIVRSGALGIIESFVGAGATLPRLLETSF